jgi:MFS transporter, DHA1 family, multidrug resistance protein
MFAYITATPFVYIEYFHVSAQHYGFLFALNIVGIMFGNFMNTRLVGRLGPLPIISSAATVSCVASLFVSLVCLTGWGGLWSIVAGLFFVVGVVGVLSADCTTELMHRYPGNAGAAAAVFGAAQLALGAASSLAVGLWQDASPKGMGATVGVAGVLCYLGRILIMRWHGAAVPSGRRSA